MFVCACLIHRRSAVAARAVVAHGITAVAAVVVAVAVDVVDCGSVCDVNIG